jgi:hypothetical protein
MRELVAATVTQRYQLIPLRDGEETRLTLGFREGQAPRTVPLETRYGCLYFYAGQALEAVRDGRRYRLTTRKYSYRLQEDESFSSQAVLRWEYDRETEIDRHARHHAHISAAVPLGELALNLDKAHLPTGWVTIEEVIRFLIVELEHKPPCGDAWPEKLAESERRFYEEFTGKRYQPPRRMRIIDRGLALPAFVAKSKRRLPRTPSLTGPRP